MILWLIAVACLLHPVCNCPTGCDCRQSPTITRCLHMEMDSVGFEHLLHSLPSSTTALSIDGSDRKCRLQLSENINRFTELRELRITGCHVPSLGRFLDLPALRLLDLSENEIDVIPVNTFTRLRNLVDLNLAGNRLSRLPTGVFRHLRQLRSLSLAHNNITFLTTNLFDGLEQLENLHLDGNVFPAPQVTGIFRELRGLRRLEMGHCQLQSLELVAFHQARQLTELGLSFNQLGFVPVQELMPLVNLRSLDLAGNEIDQVSDCAFCQLTNLTRLSLAHNRLTSLSTNAFSKTSITDLNLSYNQFPHFSARILGGLQNRLEKLAVSGLSIGDFHREIIYNLPNLTHLHLADNLLEHIPDNLPKEYSRLLLLNISGNQLHQLPINLADQLHNLKELDISRNRFSSISSTLISDFFNRLERLHLHENPFDCNCAIGALRDLLTRHETSIAPTRHETSIAPTRQETSIAPTRHETSIAPRCAQPEWLAGQSVVAIDRSDDCAMLLGFGMSQSSELLLLLVVVIALGVLLGLLLLTAYCASERQHHGSYVTRETSSCSPLTEFTSDQHLMSLAVPPPPAVIYARY